MQLSRGASDAEYDSDDDEDSMSIMNMILNPMTLN
jgi:hypothetical protein